MSITKKGIIGEQMARIVLKKMNCLESLFQADWIYKRNNKYYVVEVKNKEMFEGPPFDGYGLNYSQMMSRLQFQKDTKIRCLFLCFDEKTQGIYYQYLDYLWNLKSKKGNVYITRNKIVIFNKKNFSYKHFSNFDL